MNNKTNSFAGSGFLQRYAVVIVWIALIILFSVLRPGTFATGQNASTILSANAIIRIIVAFAIMVPLIAGDYDMSAAAVMTLSNMVVAATNVVLGLPIGVCMILGIVVGIAVGAVNGWIITKFGINPFIVTMGTQTLVAGLCLMIKRESIGGVDGFLKNLVNFKVAGLTLSFFYALIMCVVLYYIFDHTAMGKRVLIVGNSVNVAKLSGINVKKVRLICFIVSGAIAGFAGVLYTGRTGAGHPSAGLNFLMPAFAAVFLGSTCIKMGRYNPIGTMIAVYFLETGITGLQLLGIPIYIQNIFYGGALILAVLFSVLAKNAQDKREFKQEQLMRQAEMEAQKTVKSAKSVLSS